MSSIMGYGSEISLFLQKGRVEITKKSPGEKGFRIGY